MFVITRVLSVEPTDIEMETWDDPVIFDCVAVSDDSSPVEITWKHNGIKVDTGDVSKLQSIDLI